jgi:hypothetical protein
VSIDSSNWQIRAHASVEINARLLPFSLHGSFRSFLKRGDVCTRGPAKKLHVNGPKASLIEQSSFIRPARNGKAE